MKNVKEVHDVAHALFKASVGRFFTHNVGSKGLSTIRELDEFPHYDFFKEFNIHQKHLVLYLNHVVVSLYVVENNFLAWSGSPPDVVEKVYKLVGDR